MDQLDLRQLLRPRWIITTLLVIAAVAVMVRLGFWQLDRLAQRRAFNARVEAQVSAPALDLNKPLPQNSALTGMEYRTVTARGEYDPQNEFVLRNQVYNNQPGYHLITPLRLDGSSQSVLVDRGFIPMEDAAPVARAKYAEPGTVTVTGIIRLGHVPQFFGVPDPALAPGQTRLDAWNSVNLPRIQQQIPYALLPVYVKAAPDASASAETYPIASIDQPDISEGPHMGYAIQWFSFAAILALGYPYFIRRQLKESPEGEKVTKEKVVNGK